MADRSAVDVQITTRDNDRLVLQLTGELDYSTAAAFREAVFAHRTKGDRYVVLDLSGVRFCDSAGLTSLLEMVRKMRDTGGRLLVAGPRASLTRTLEMTGLDVLISTYPSVADALAALPPSGIDGMGGAGAA